MPRPRVVAKGLVLLALGLSLASCSWARKARSRPRRTSPVSEPGRFALHEWGVFAIDANDRAHASATSQVGPGIAIRIQGAPRQRTGIEAVVLKPVIYVHLDPDVPEARFDLRLGIPSDRLVERWPAAGALPESERTTQAGWLGVRATAQPCEAPLAAPQAYSDACNAVADGFCEASEIPRYQTSLDTCLLTGEGDADRAATRLLFYRTSALRTPELPLEMVRTADGWSPRSHGELPVDGPVFFVTTPDSGRTVTIHSLGPSERDAPPSGRRFVSTLTPDEARDVLEGEAIRRGLTEAEAEALADAWAPAVFSRRVASDDAASGRFPVAVLPNATSLLYFAPREVVDAMIPLATDPPARRTARVFLLRFVDGSAPIAREESMRVAAETAGADDGVVELVATVTPGEPTVSTGLEVAQVTRVIRRHLGELRFCYSQRLPRSPRLAGRLTISFLITPTGGVGSASPSAFAEDREIGRCLASAVRRFAFPAPTHGGPVSVRQPIELSAAPAALP